MARDHYLPAYHIGQFSYDKGQRPRDNPVWVKRRNVPKAFFTSAAKVGYKNNLYNKEIDALWKGVEGNLKEAVTGLLYMHEQPLKLRFWLTLVQFIAQLFVRGYEFDERFDARLDAMGEGLSNKIRKVIPDDTNMARRMELQRLYAPIMYAEWILVYNSSEKPIITNDLGYCCMLEKQTDKLGYSIPLFPGAILSLTIGGRSQTRTVPLEENNGEKIVTFIRQESIDATGVEAVNNILGDFCLAEIYGPTKESVNMELNSDIKGRFGHQANYLIPKADPDFLRLCEMDYFKLLSKI